MEVDSSAAVRIVGVRKSYGSTHAVRGVSLEMHTGRITALLGHNGAGKSTLVSVITGATHILVRTGIGYKPWIHTLAAC